MCVKEDNAFVLALIKIKNNNFLNTNQQSLFTINRFNPLNMKRILFAFLMATLLLGNLQLVAQNDVESLHGISAKILFIDYGTPNSKDSLKISNGLEVAYIRNINPILNIAIPGKIGLVNLENNDERITFGSVDVLLQAQLAKEGSRFIPYVLGGGGITFVADEDANVQIPLGAGLNFKVGENSFINAQAEYRLSMADDRNNLQFGVGWHFRLVPNPNREILPPDRDGDGITDEQDACPDTRGSVTASGCPDRDGDGVTDAEDSCPKVAGSPNNGGCPLINEKASNDDTDGDGIKNENDDCPENAGVAALNGCPDGDGDGVADKDDQCPGVPGLKENNGCPVQTSIDSDGDGVTNDKDECPDVAGIIQLLGCPDSDGDGVIDKNDKCPNEAGPANRKGCPAKDSDGDGILDEDDECPNEAGKTSTQGCPDSDGDGVADKKDSCPNLYGKVALLGCPDKDNDGVIDPNDKCPDEAGPAARNGCPIKDSDRDGILDENDECPYQKGTVDTNGCPDSDGDGVVDKNDRCPNLAGALNGCPDSDGDGVANIDDECPNEPGIISGCPDSDGDGIHNGKDKCVDSPGPADNNGCPKIKEEDLQVLKFATDNVQFATGKATLKAQSYSVLDQVAEVLKKYPDYHLSISGHTDNVGTPSANQALSEERAASCYQYILSRQIAESRMVYKGFGEKQPVGLNNTEEGREQNRRVAFDLFIPR